MIKAVKLTNTTRNCFHGDTYNVRTTGAKRTHPRQLRLKSCSFFRLAPGKTKTIPLHMYEASEEEIKAFVSRGEMMVEFLTVDDGKVVETAKLSKKEIQETTPEPTEGEKVEEPEEKEEEPEEKEEEEPSPEPPPEKEEEEEETFENIPLEDQEKGEDGEDFTQETTKDIKVPKKKEEKEEKPKKKTRKRRSKKTE